MNAVRSIGRLAQNNSCLFVCDIQEKFRNQIFGFSQIVEVSKRLINAAEILEIPIIVTEQYPKGRLTLLAGARRAHTIHFNQLSRFLATT